MELEIRRRESTGSGPNTYVETETLAKFELMDGAPVRGIAHISPPLVFLKACIAFTQTCCHLILVKW
jgi:vacuolar protein sorting-associated protein 26